MLRPSLVLLALLILLRSALASQSASNFDQQITELNRQVLEACQAKKYDVALKALGELNALQPEHSGNAYNHACVHSLNGNTGEGLAWLERAVSWGFGGSKARIFVPGASAPSPIWHAQMAEQDQDLAPLRAEPRFARLLERMRATQTRVEEYTAKPGLFVPSALEGRAEAPVLVLLHAAGSERDATVQRFRALAERHGLVLLVPAAPVPMKEAAAAGMRWIDDPVAFRAGQDRDVALAAVDRALSQLSLRGIQPESLCFAGLGEGGTLALLAAFAKARQTRAVCAVDPNFELDWVFAQSAAAKQAGLRLCWIETLAADAAQVEARRTAQARRQAQCVQWGLSDPRCLLEGSGAAEPRERLLETHLGPLLAPLAPAAGSSDSLPPSPR